MRYLALGADPAEATVGSITIIRRGLPLATHDSKMLAAARALNIPPVS